MAASAHERIVAEIERRGPVPFVDVVELALYDPRHGFYAGAGGSAGRRGGDFVTSVEAGPLFAAVLAGALDGWWRELGSPDPFVVVDAGAGRGTLARGVLQAAPQCAPALRYVLVERSAAQRRRHAEHLALEEASFAFAPAERDVEAPPTLTGRGPICVSLGELPRVAGPAIVVANELLDNLPFGLAERGDEGWLEVRVGLADGDRLAETLVPAATDTAAMLDRLAPDAATGARVPVQHAAQRWLRDALALTAAGGRVVAFDYMDTTAAMAARSWSDWVRTYHAHERGRPPLEALGSQDVTCEVASDQLALVRAPDVDRSQREWLVAHGIDALVDEGRRIWSDRASIGDLEALAGRSRVTEAQALLDPTGLGGFRVLEWSGLASDPARRDHGPG